MLDYGMDTAGSLCNESSKRFKKDGFRQVSRWRQLGLSGWKQQMALREIRVPKQAIDTISTLRIQDRQT